MKIDRAVDVMGESAEDAMMDGAGVTGAGRSGPQSRRETSVSRASADPRPVSAVRGLSLSLFTLVPFNDPASTASAEEVDLGQLIAQSSSSADLELSSQPYRAGNFYGGHFYIGQKYHKIHLRRLFKAIFRIC